MVPNLDVIHPSTNVLNNTTALVAQDNGERALGVLT